MWRRCGHLLSAVLCVGLAVVKLDILNEALDRWDSLSWELDLMLCKRAGNGCLVRSDSCFCFPPSTLVFVLFALVSFAGGVCRNCPGTVAADGRGETHCIPTYSGVDPSQHSL